MNIHAHTPSTARTIRATAIPKRLHKMDVTQIDKHVSASPKISKPYANALINHPQYDVLSWGTRRRITNALK